MSERRPLDRVRGAVHATQDERRVQRMWRNVEAARGEARPRSRLRPVIALAVVSTLAVFALVGREQWARHRAATARDALSGTLVADGAARRIALADGSTLALDVGTRLDVIERAPRNVELALRRGRVAFDVKRTDPSTWRVDCGAVEIAFVGAALSIEREDDAVELRVQRGAVVARGEPVPDRVQRLTAGAHMRIALTHEVTHAAHTPHESSDIEPVAMRFSEAEVAALGDERAAPVMSWRRAASLGRYRDAYDALGEGGVAREARALTEPDDLLTLADVARLSGHPAQAVAPLERIAALHAGDARAGLATYMLAQLYLDRLGKPGPAASAYGRALDLGLPATMQELAMARRVEALGRASSAEVADAAASYLARYPSGRYRGDVARWLTP